MSGNHPFDRSGLAALSDLETPEWRELFSRLEQEQTEFLALESQFRSPEYKWPRDPLHTWSRVWEYPYAYHHLRKWCLGFSCPGQPHVADVGSGVTFFPFSVARLGYRVTCTDIDPNCERDLNRAIALVDSRPGTVAFRRCDENRLPFDDAELDAAYCISVLEHIPEFEKTIAEIARVLKPGGLLVLSIDLDLRGDCQIAPEPYRRLKSALQRYFAFACPESTVHPGDLLTSTGGPFPIRPPSGLARACFFAKQTVKLLLGCSSSPALLFRLCVEAMVLTKKKRFRFVTAPKMIRKAAIISTHFLWGDPPQPVLGGVTTYCQSLLSLLRQLGYQTTIIFPGPKHLETNYCGTRALALPSGRRNRYTVLFGLPWAFQQTLRQTLAPGELAILMHIDVAYPWVPPHSIFVQHGVTWDGMPNTPGASRLHRFFQGRQIAAAAVRNYRATRLATKTVCVDTAYISAYRQYCATRGIPFVGDKLHYIPNFADPEAKEVVEAKIGQMKSGSARILFARRFEDYRGAGLQGQVASVLAREFRDCEWVFAGSGPLLPQLKELCRQLPKGRILKATPDEMRDLHNQTDIAVIPSLYSEGTSLSCVEAMCAGCVPVVTDVGGLPNLVLPDYNGCIVRPTEADLISALRVLIKDVNLRQRLAINAWATASAAFSRAAWSQRWEKVIREMEYRKPTLP